MSTVMPDLFDVLDEIEAPEGERFHVLMPNMGLACGADVLGSPPRLHRFVVGVGGGNWDRVTCPECLSLGRDALADKSATTQGRTA